jgi:hypothetical protein
MEARKRITLIGYIFIFNSILKSVIDIILTPVLISEFGFLKSLSITTFIYFLIGIISVKIYDFYKIDFFMIEALKKSQCENNQFYDKSIIVSIILKWTQKNKIILGLLLACQNVGLVVIYFRDGFYDYNGFCGKNIKLIFFIYLLIINIYWNIGVYISNLAIKDLP